MPCWQEKSAKDGLCFGAASFPIWVGRHGCTIEEIKELFHSYSDKIITEPMDNEEFDVMIRFDDGSDPYYYCFKDEGCHIIYHRFLPEDYADFGF